MTYILPRMSLVLNSTENGGNYDEKKQNGQLDPNYGSSS